MTSHDIPNPAETAWWRLSRVIEETGLSRSTIYRLMEQGKFPKSHKLKTAEAVIWLSNEVIEWKASELAPAEDDIEDML